MPYLRKDAPAHIPVHEHIESLLGLPRNPHSSSDPVKPLQDLTTEERKQTNILNRAPGDRVMRTDQIQGDPYGVWQSWCGNANHPEDTRIAVVLEPILDQLLEKEMKNSEDVQAIRGLLTDLPKMGLRSVAAESANENDGITIKEDALELTVLFTLKSYKVRLMQAKDLDVKDVKTYSQSSRAKASVTKEKMAFNEEKMPIEAQQYLMAQILQERQDEFQQAVQQATQKPPMKKATANKGVFARLRTLARERYWTTISEQERNDIRQVAKTHVDTPSLDTALASNLQTVKKNWFNDWWKNNQHDIDPLQNFVRDKRCAETVWPLIEEDIVVVVDMNLKVVTANIEKLCQILYGEEVHDLLDRAVDLWTFYCPLPIPETGRHAVNGYIRKLHPELDPLQATVETLPNAKMSMGYYGCWSAKGDPQGRELFSTPETQLSRMSSASKEMKRIFPKFARAVFGKTSALIRFLIQPLDNDYYRECAEIFANLPDSATLKADEKEEDFISLYALGINGYTQRHKDSNDIVSGLVGLFTLGRYKGGNLCIPQLDLKVKYAPGACAILRGNELEHLVQDFEPPRWFIVGTNHKECQQNAWRKLGRAPPLPPPKNGRKRAHEEMEEEANEVAVVEGPVVNDGANADNGHQTE